jgi:hypothetical protein
VAHAVAAKTTAWSGLWVMEVGGDGSDGRRRGNSGWRGETAGGMRPWLAREGGSPAGGLRLVSAPGCTVEVGRPKSAFSLF